MKLLSAAIVAAVFALSTGGPALAAKDVALADAQVLLHILGFYDGKFDGVSGKKTDAAFAAFYAARGGSFDGAFGANEVDDIFAALRELPFNGKGPTLSATEAKTNADPKYDFVPPVDLAAALPNLETLVPLDSLSDKMRAAGGSMWGNLCNWVENEHFPDAGQPLKTYASMKEFNGPAGRHPRNKWVDDLNFYSERAGSRLLAVSFDSNALNAFKTALLAHSAAGSALDIVNLLDPKTGEVIVTPDFGTVLIATQGITFNYLMNRPLLKLTAAEQTQIETWLDRLFETYADNYFWMNPESAVRDPRAVDMVGRADMAAGLLRNDVALFNTGAHLVATALSFTREDGSHRFGASRGSRALFYQGIVLTGALSELILLEAEGLPAREVLLPTIDRQAEFWARAWDDHKVLYPYAKENASAVTGSSYKVQDMVEPAPGIDAFLFLEPQASFAPTLREARKQYEWPSMFGENFNMSCMGLLLVPPKSK